MDLLVVSVIQQITLFYLDHHVFVTQLIIGYQMECQDALVIMPMDGTVMDLEVAHSQFAQK